MIALEPDIAVDAMPLQRMVERVNQLAEAKSCQDIEKALEIYHPEGTLITPPFNFVAKGESIRSSMETFFKNFPDYSVKINKHVACDKTLISWGEISLTLNAEPNGHIPNGQCAKLPVFILFAFKDDRVIWESFNFDLGSLCHQSGVPLAAFYQQQRIIQTEEKGE